MKDVVAVGELLIDFTENGISEQGNKLFEANPGGAPCNVLAMLQKLGRSTAFIGKVGDDAFGHMLQRTVRELGIDVSDLTFDQKIPTTLAFVQTAPDGDRDFSFYRKPGADMMLRKTDINTALVKDTKIMHFGTLSMTDAFCAEATQYAIAAAKENGALISFDPNLRKPLWDDLQDAKEKMLWGIAHCDILKISDDEVTFLTGEADVEQGVRQLLSAYHTPFVCATMGKNGSKAFFDGNCIQAEPFLLANTIETTGAGDTFCACMLHDILNNGIENRSKESVYQMLRFANAGAALITTRRGALRVMPTAKEIRGLIG